MARSASGRRPRAAPRPSPGSRRLRHGCSAPHRAVQRRRAFRVERAVVQVRAAFDQQPDRLGPPVHGRLVERGEVAPAAGVDGHAAVEQGPHDIRASEQGELSEDPSVVVGLRVPERRRRRGGQSHRLAARDREHRGVDGIEVRGRAAGPQQLVGGEMAATRGQRERSPAHVPAVPREVDVRAGIEQQRDDRQAAAAADRVVQAAVRVDIDAAGEEPGQAGGVLEVELVVDHALEAGRVEHVEQRGVRLLAGVVEGVLVPRRAALEQQPDEREVAAFHRVEQRGHAALAVPLDRVTVRVGAASRSSRTPPRTSAGEPVERRSRTSNGASAPTAEVAAVGSASRWLKSATGSASMSARSTPCSPLACAWRSSLGRLGGSELRSPGGGRRCRSGRCRRAPGGSPRRPRSRRRRAGPGRRSRGPRGPSPGRRSPR